MDYRKEITESLRKEAAKAVEGSEFGVDEHHFGIAAEMIKNSIPKEKLIEVIYQLKNTTVGGVTSGVVAAKAGCLNRIVKLLEALVEEETHD